MTLHLSGINSSRQAPSINARKFEFYRVLILIGIVVTFLSSMSLIALHEHVFVVRYGHPFFQSESRPFSEVSQKIHDGLIRNRPGQNPMRQQQNYREEWPPVLSVYMEPSSTYDVWYDDPSGDSPRIKKPLPQRNLHSHDLKRLSFPNLNYSSYVSNSHSSQLCNQIPALLPVDQFGTTILDPYLPWIHDLFISHDGKNVHIVAQNRRRCHKGKFHKEEMRFWEGQVALFQPVAVKRLNGDASDHYAQYRLSTHEEADSDGIETRFICRFKLLDTTQQTLSYQGESLSTYPFNYEFVNWRKKKHTMVEDTKDQTFFWLSPLMFHCPVPKNLLQYTTLQNRDPSSYSRYSGEEDSASTTTSATLLLLDIIPIRTPVRRNDRDGFFFHSGHGGPMSFNASEWWGDRHVLPNAEDSGRWENLPACELNPPKPPSETIRTNSNENKNSDAKVNANFNSNNDENAHANSDKNNNNDSNAVIFTNKPYRLVACTWTSALHQRRGNERRIIDGKSRLREWIAFHLEAGFDHLYVFDNTGANSTIFRLKNEVDPDFGKDEQEGRDAVHRIQDDLSSVTNLFHPSTVTRIDWPATICNNNRPAHDDPG